MKKQDDRFSGPPDPAPSIDGRLRQSQQLLSIGLSNKQILIILILVVSLVVLAFYRGTQQATLLFYNLSWEPLNSTCRVSFTAKNPKGHAINARALIQLYMSAGNVPVASPMYVPTTTVTVPIQLAPGQSRTITSDVDYLEKPEGCQ